MAVRTVRVGPDSIHETLDGRQIAVLSMQGQINALAQFAGVCDACGGGFSVAYGRLRTGLEGEYVTTGIMLNWRDRGDAKSQPEESIRFEDASGLTVYGEEMPEEQRPQLVEDEGVDVEIVDNGLVEDAAAV